MRQRLISKTLHERMTEEPSPGMLPSGELDFVDDPETEPRPTGSSHLDLIEAINRNAQEDDDDDAD